MLFDLALMVMGIFLLFFGGEGLLKGSVALSLHYGLSKILVSAVVIGFGTSMPEMTVSVGAALKGSPELALGNVLGSNVANLLLIVGVAALLSPIVTKGLDVGRDTAMMLISAAVLCMLSFAGVINFTMGVAMFALLVGYIVFAYKQDRRKTKAAKHLVEDIDVEAADMPPLKAFIYAVIGLALLVAGATLLVDGATAIARSFGISEAVIGLTLVAVGTSLPELATAAVAAYRKHTDMILGNVLGSNVFNSLAILGVTAIIKPLPFMGELARVDVWVMAAVSVLVGLILWRKIKLNRTIGLLFLVIYTSYMLYLAQAGSLPV